jgi:hypothetical protein
LPYSIEEFDITLALLYNKIYIKNIALSSLVKSYLPSKLEYVAISYTLINPFVAPTICIVLMLNLLE